MCIRDSTHTWTDFFSGMYQLETRIARKIYLQNEKPRCRGQGAPCWPYRHWNAWMANEPQESERSGANGNCIWYTWGVFFIWLLLLYSLWTTFPWGIKSSKTGDWFNFFDATPRIGQLRPTRRGKESDTVPSLERHTNLFEWSEFLIDTSPPKNLSVDACVFD